MALTEKGSIALKYVLEYFPTGSFSAKDLSNACGVNVAAATLNAVANNGYIIKLGGSPVMYTAIDDLAAIISSEEEEKTKGCDNSNLHKAKRVKNDEFYTRYEDIEAEVMKYRKQFKDKIVYLPCDDPAQKKSEFWSFFVNNFDTFGLKKLIATHYDENGQAYRIWLDEDLNHDGYIDDWDAQQEDLIGNGDFRSPECVDILKECDIVVTNPPFSLFKEFLPLILTHEKQFLVIGPLNAITYQEIFAYISRGRIWSGYNNVHHFNDPDGKDNTMGNVLWFTNMPNRSLTEKLILTKKYDTTLYDKYDNFDAINVNKVVDIPMNYDGLMGVPVSFFQGKYNPNQFDVVGLMASTTVTETNFGYPYINGKKKYARIIIKKK